MDWMWEHYTYMSHAEEAARGLTEVAYETLLAEREVAEQLAASLRELGELAYTEAVKCTRTPHHRQASMPLARPRRARRLAMQQNRPPGIAPG